MVTSRLLFAGLVVAVATQRLFELRLARRNTKKALAAGAVELGASHYPWMVALHSGFLLSAVAEVFWLGRPFEPWLASAMAALLVVASALRIWVIRTLGDRWTTRVICFPGRQAVRRGPYKALRHPNYLAVVLEIFALPMVHGAWLTALAFSGLNLVLLRTRIRVEEDGLGRYSDYEEVFGER